MLNGLTPQVHVISLDQGAVRHIGFHDLSEESWSKIMNNALFDTNIYDYLPHVRNIRIFIPGSPAPPHAQIKHIDYIRTLIRDMDIPQPDLLDVPPFAPGALENMTGARDVASRLARVCEARGVELVYEEQRHDWTRDSVFSRDFSRRIREREEAEGRRDWNRKKETAGTLVGLKWRSFEFSCRLFIVIRAFPLFSHSTRIQTARCVTFSRVAVSFIPLRQLVLFHGSDCSLRVHEVYSCCSIYSFASRILISATSSCTCRLVDPKPS